MFVDACVGTLLLAGTTVLVGCERTAEAVTPQKIEQQYGVSGAYTDEVTSPTGRCAARSSP
jgi:hypothetical protein